MFRKTLRMFEIAVKINPDNPLTCYKWSMSLYDLGKTKRSIKMLLRVMRLQPNFLKSYIALKIILNKYMPEQKMIIKQINKCWELIESYDRSPQIPIESQKLIKMVNKLKIRKILKENSYK